MCRTRQDEFTQDVKNRRRLEDKDICQCCGVTCLTGVDKYDPRRLVLDHWHPVSDKDSYPNGPDRINEYDNCRVMCRRCNGKKKDANPLDEDFTLRIDTIRHEVRAYHGLETGSSLFGHTEQEILNDIVRRENERERKKEEYRASQRKSYSEKRCLVCGVDFKPGWHYQVLCGESECRREYVRRDTIKRRVRVSYPEKPCVICENMFTPPRYDTVTCPNPECKKEHNRIRCQEYYDENLRVSLPEKPCIICEDIFQPRAERNIVCDKPECKEEHALRSWRKHRPPKNHPEKPCIICEDMFQPDDIRHVLCGKPECKREKRRRYAVEFRKKQKAKKAA